MSLDVYDQGNGSVQLEWTAYPAASSYNVYVNGVLNQNVSGLLATVSGLAQESYSASAIASPSGNSTRPQNMPPNGVVTPSGTYVFNVIALVSGVERGSAGSKTITLSPTSIMLATPMKRLWPFPNAGLD